jgi:transcriptional regulator with XRE-family HTH domain
MHENLTPTLCLDGSAVRRIREEKKLTQLYVAKVVGVTTDTISRWENNRYPTVRRENVLKLAEALEVPLEDLLKSVGIANGDALMHASHSPRRFSPKMAVASLLVVALLLLLAGFWLVQRKGMANAEISTERVLPRYAAPGNLVPVRVRLNVEGQTKGFILRENFPPDWTLVEASPAASSVDAVDGTIRWIIKPGESRLTIAYLVRVSSEAEMGDVGRFRGEVVVHPNGRSTLFPVAGGSRVQVSPTIWADLDGDGSIDDGEMLQASETFDEMEGIHLDWSQLEAIWDAGRYRWDSDAGTFHPVPRKDEG